jgi:hypothetical protein
LALTRLISKAGGFRWVSKNRSVHLTLIISGLLLATSTNMIGCVYNLGQGGSAEVLNLYWRITPVLLLLLMVTSTAMLLYFPARLLTYLRLVRWAFTLVFLVSIVGIGRYCIFPIISQIKAGRL